MRGCDHQAARRLADLALQDAKLMAESKHLGAELGVGAGAYQDEVDHEELVGKAEKHARGNAPCRHDDPRAPAGPAPRHTPGHPRRCPVELTLTGTRHTSRTPSADTNESRVL